MEIPAFFRGRENFSSDMTCRSLFELRRWGTVVVVFLSALLIGACRIGKNYFLTILDKKGFPLYITSNDNQYK
jgi:hypothetical protein